MLINEGTHAVFRFRLQGSAQDSTHTYRLRPRASQFFQCAHWRHSVARNVASRASDRRQYWYIGHDFETCQKRIECSTFINVTTSCHRIIPAYVPAILQCCLRVKWRRAQFWRHLPILGYSKPKCVLYYFFLIIGRHARRWVWPGVRKLRAMYPQQSVNALATYVAFLFCDTSCLAQVKELESLLQATACAKLGHTISANRFDSVDNCNAQNLMGGFRKPDPEISVAMRFQ